MTSQGSAYTRFRRAIDTGDFTIIRAAATELPQIGLADALRICWAIRHTEPDAYDRACVRWLGRFCLEADGVALAEVKTASAALSALTDQGSERDALESLRTVCARYRLPAL